MGWKYLGPVPSDPKDLVTKEYADALETGGEPVETALLGRFYNSSQKATSNDEGLGDEIGSWTFTMPETGTAHILFSCLHKASTGSLSATYYFTIDHETAPYAATCGDTYVSTTWENFHAVTNATITRTVSAGTHTVNVRAKTSRYTLYVDEQHLTLLG